MSRPADALKARVGAVRRYLYRRSVLAAGIWVASGVLTVWAVAWLWAGDGGWRPGSVGPLVLDVAIVLWLLGGAYAFRRVVDRWLREDRLAHAIERAASLPAGEVRGTLELGRAMPEGVSPRLAARATERAEEGLRSFGTSELSGSLGRDVNLWIRRGWGGLFGATLVLVALTALAPARSLQAWSGLATPLRVLSGPTLPPLQVEPGHAEVMRGADVSIRVRAEGRREVELRWQGVGDVAHSESVEVDRGWADYELRGVAVPTEYRVHGDAGTTSERYVITPVDPLFVGDLRIELDFPSHTGRAAEEYRGAAPPLQIPEGTRIAFDGRANRPLSTATLTDSVGVAEVELAIDSAEFDGRWTPETSGRYTWLFRDSGGEAPADVPPPIELVVQADQVPFVEITSPARDTVLSSDLSQRLAIEAGDDHGLAELELVAHRVTALGEHREPVVQRFDLGETRFATARPVLDFSSWGLMPGDEVRYSARVADNAPDAQWAETGERVLRMPSASELRRDVERAFGDAAERLSQLREAAEAEAEGNRQEARERTLGSGASRATGQRQRSGADTDFDERESLRRAVEEQERMTAAVDSLGADLEAMERRMEEVGQADPELRGQMRELQDLLDQVAGEDLESRTERLSEAIEQGDVRGAERSLQELSEEQERFRERLEESLERFRRAAVEQDFSASRNEAEDLARQERALADAMREDGTTELRAEQQEGLAERAEELDARLDRLEERLREIGEEGAAEGVREAGARAEQARAEMSEVGRNADEGRAEEASSRAERASERLDEAGRELRQAQQDMAMEQLTRMRRALERTADDALSLARRQTGLRLEMRGATPDELRGMRSDERTLLQGMENVADNLRVATDGQVPGGREISEQMGRIMESFERTLASMERPRSMNGSPVAASERVVGDLNELALMALRFAEQMGQAGEEQGRQQEGAEQERQQAMQQALEELAQQQGDLVNQAGQIMPMQLGEQALSEQLQEMSDGQQSVSDQLGELSDQPASEGALGDLEQLAGEAREVAESLAEGRLDPETAQRQERLFHRLLDAGRSLERDEVSEQRESEAPTGFERGTVMPLEDGQLGVLEFGMPSAEQLRELPSAVRRMILDYFERLNRVPSAPDDGGAS
ncbi:MAG: hypothetical protein U5R14_05645 [Gemmatimonadota bacterium]|nr:hypothetical protein [Gemmatimonadota bacterium]